jgi:hypothetical protein
VSILGYIDKERTNLTLISEGFTDTRGRAVFLLPQGSYVVSLKYSLFSSNVTVELPPVRSIVELDWTVNRVPLAPLTIMFSDKYGTGELLPGDQLEAIYSAENANAPILVEVRGISSEDGSRTSHILQTVEALQDGNVYWVSMTPESRIPMSLIDAEAASDFSGYWVTVGVRERPWR